MDLVQFLVEVEGHYCLITPRVCLMTCRGLIWVTYSLSTPDYVPTPDEALALQLAVHDMGYRDFDEIDFHHATVDVVPADQEESRSPIRLH